MWPRWLQRQRAEPDGDTPEPAPVVRADWRELPPVTRVVPEHPLINPVQRFSDSLTSWQNPSFLAPLGHRIGPAEPSGVADLALPAAPDLDLPLARPPRDAPGSRRPAVQRAVAAEPFVSPVADAEPSPVQLSSVDGPGPTVAPPVEHPVLELPVVTTPDRLTEPAAEQSDVDIVPTIAAPEPPDPPARAEAPPAPPLPQPQLSIPRRLGLGEPIIPPTVHSRPPDTPPAPVQRSVSPGGDGPRPGLGFGPVPVRGTETEAGSAPPPEVDAGPAPYTRDVAPTLGAEPDPDPAGGMEPAAPSPALDGDPAPSPLPLAAAGPASVVQTFHGEPPAGSVVHESHTEPVTAPVVPVDPVPRPEPVAHPVVQTVPDEPPPVHAEPAVSPVVLTLGVEPPAELAVRAEPVADPGRPAAEDQVPLDLAVRGGPAPAPVTPAMPVDPVPRPGPVASPVVQTLGVEPPADPAVDLAERGGPVTSEPPASPMPPVVRGGPVTGPVVQRLHGDPQADLTLIAGRGEPIVQTIADEPAAPPADPLPASEPAATVQTLGAGQAGEPPSPVLEPSPSAPGGDIAGPLPVVRTEPRTTVQTMDTAVPAPSPTGPHPTVQTLGMEPGLGSLPADLGSAPATGQGPDLATAAGAHPHPAVSAGPVPAGHTEPAPAPPTSLPVAGTGSRPTVQTTQAVPEPTEAFPNLPPVTGADPGPTVQTLGVGSDFVPRLADPKPSTEDSGLPAATVSDLGVGPVPPAQVVQTLGAMPRPARPFAAPDPVTPPGATVQRVSGPVATPPASAGARTIASWSAEPVELPGPTSPTLGAEPGLTVLTLAAPVSGPPGPTVSRLAATEPAAPMPTIAPAPQRLIMSAPATVSPVSVAVQRVDEVPAAEPPPPAEPAPAAAPEAAPAPVPAQAAAAGGDPEELVKKLFDPLLRRLKTELRLDRERHGRLTDLTH
jgi:hypothetical protein